MSMLSLPFWLILSLPHGIEASSAQNLSVSSTSAADTLMIKTAADSAVSASLASPYFKGIELTQQQADSVSAIRKRYAVQHDQVRRDGGGPSVMLPRAFAIIDKSAAEMRKLLTPEQKVAFDRNEAEAKKSRQAILEESVKLMKKE